MPAARDEARHVPALERRLSSARRVPALFPEDRVSPTAPLGPCIAYGCPDVREAGHRTCPKPEHRALERAANLRSQRRRRKVRRVYSTKAWAELSARKLRRDPFCELRIKCDGAPATDVDHVDPISWGGRELPPIDELRSACHECHSAHTAETMLDRDDKGRWVTRPPWRNREEAQEVFDRAKAIVEGKRGGDPLRNA